MDSNVIESDAGRACACETGPTLGVLNDVHRAYEERMDVINRTAGSQKLQKQVELFQSWVGDLVAQNGLLARTVEDLEIELTSRILSERRKYSEMVAEMRVEVSTLRRRLARKDSDLRGLLELLRRLREQDYCAIDNIHFNEVTQSDIFGPVTWLVIPQNRAFVDYVFISGRLHWSGATRGENERSNKGYDHVDELKQRIDILQKDNLSKEREIRKLNKDLQQYEHSLANLKKEVSRNDYHTTNVSGKDVAVMTDVCLSGSKECGDAEPVKEFGGLLSDAVRYHEQIQHMESSGDSVRALREMNVSLTDEVHALHRVCAALDEQCRVSALRSQFKEEIIREMRRQLRKAKAKLKEGLGDKSNFDAQSGARSYESLCVSQQPRRKRRELPDLDMNTDWICQNFDGSGDDGSFKGQ
ncbi:unnamed protein product [Leptosia nina]|uniref:Uncharacterized protein n=1 Tax=Leptosia nina TaxID=320188 RepID=A0AAV1JRX1_9NEOP